MDNPQQWSRRKFVYTISGAGALMLVNPNLIWARKTIDPGIAKIVAESFGIDTHNHIDVAFEKSAIIPKIDLAGQMQKSGLNAICMTFAVDRPELKDPGQAYERFLNGLTAMDAILLANSMQRSLNLSDIQLAHKNRQPTVIQSVEGGHFLEGRIDRLKVAYDRGLRHLGLLHDNDASVPLGDVFTNRPQFGGLTSFGAEVIREAERLGMLVDLSHATNETINMALDVASRPVLISHTGLDSRLGSNQKFAEMMRPRLISKEQAKTVADSGGVIGIWTHLADSPMEYADNIKAMVDTVGIDHVAIGTDTKLTSADIDPKIGQSTNLVWQSQKQGFYYVVVESLLAIGYTQNDIAKIGGGNFLRIFDAATKKN